MKSDIPTNIFRATLKKSSDYVKVHQGDKNTLTECCCYFQFGKSGPTCNKLEFMRKQLEY